MNQELRIIDRFQKSISDLCLKLRAALTALALYIRFAHTKLALRLATIFSTDCFEYAEKILASFRSQFETNITEATLERGLLGRSGQVMVVSVVLLGGMLLSAAAVAGTLLTYQIRQMNDVKKSAAAFYASDSGMEAAGFCLLKPFRCPTKPPYCPGGVCYSDLKYPLDKDFIGFVEGSGPTFTVSKAIDLVTKEANVVAKGEFANAIRALEAIFILP